MKEKATLNERIVRWSLLPSSYPLMSFPQVMSATDGCRRRDLPVSGAHMSHVPRRYWRVYRSCDRWADSGLSLASELGNRDIGRGNATSIASLIVASSSDLLPLFPLVFSKGKGRRSGKEFTG